MEKVATAIKDNDLAAYQHMRYPSIPDGEPVKFNDEDFSNTDFEQFVAGFFEFNNCNLDNSRKLYGQPISINGGAARGIDLRGVRAIFNAADCDFSGLLYDDTTELAYGDKELDARSVFKNCTLDQNTKHFFSAQGVNFVDSATKKST